MATSVSICSAALVGLGKTPIASFDHTGALAQACRIIYPDERDSLLRSHPWNCASKRAVLAALSEKPAFGYGAAFPLPSDFLRLLSVGDRWVFDGPFSTGYRGFKVEGRNILSAGTSLSLQYIFRNDVEATWDAHLVSLMTARMRWRLCYLVTQSTSKEQSAAEEYERMAKQARATDSQEDESPTFGGDESYGYLQGRY